MVSLTNFCTMIANSIITLKMYTISVSFYCWMNVISFLQIFVQYGIIQMVVLSNMDKLQHCIYCWCWRMHKISSLSVVFEHQFVAKRLLMAEIPPIFFSFNGNGKILIYWVGRFWYLDGNVYKNQYIICHYIGIIKYISDV